METAVIFNIQRYCLDDGEGIRTTVFFKGCPLRCIWCHNPESWLCAPEILYDGRRCIGCGECVGACPSGCQQMKHTHEFLRSCCTACGACADICPAGALELAGRRWTVAEVLAVVERDRVYYRSGGGLTLSGGEPLMQAKFAAALAAEAKRLGLSVNVETSGYGSLEDVKMLVPHCDRFLFDIKAPPEDYPRYTGKSYEPVRANLLQLRHLGASVTLRCPVVPECNGTDRFAEHIAAAARESGADAVHLLPYHSSGLGKCGLLGNAPQPQFHPPSISRLREMADKITVVTGIAVMIK